MNIGIIGAGMIAEAHIKGFQLVPGTVVNWIAGSTNKDRLKELQTKFKIKNITTDYHDILNDPETDVVVICTPPKLHEKMFIEALQAGKHTLIEKPMAISEDELDRMLAEAAKFPNLIISDCSARHARLTPKYRLVKEIIDSGKLGDIYYIHHNSVNRQGRPGIEYHPTAKWFLNKAIAGGGPILDWGVYDLSFHLGILSDKPELLNVKAFTKMGLDNVDPGTPINDVEEHAVVFMEFTNGLKYYWERANHANVEAPDETRIYGTKGGLKLAFCSWESPDIEFFDVDNNGKGKARKQVFTADFSKHLGDIEELDKSFVEAVINKKDSPMPIALAAKHLKILFKVYEACKVK
jgi:predicted dehydrogenase